MALLAVPSAPAAPPTLIVPDDITVEAEGPAGAKVTFEPTAAAASQSLTLTCDPQSGSTFPIAATTVTCTARDNETGETTTRSFVVRVVDTRPPVLSGVSGGLTLEATSRAGARAAYPSATATDVVDGTVPVSCSPAAGSILPLGSTTVTCRATDKHGNTGTATFTVTVRDTKGPVFARAPVVVRNVNGIVGERVRYTPPRAVDAVDGPVAAQCAPPPGSLFKLGVTKVVCHAKDSRGNASAFTFRLELRDTTPPPQVSALAIARAPGAITVSWRKPSGSDFAGVVVVRTPGVSSSAGSVVYRGSGTSFTDRDVRAGVDYRYEVFSVDHAGNRSVGLVAGKGEAAIIAPAAGAELTSPPLLEWRAVEGAAYYNVQLYRGGQKILSTWPTESRLRLSKTWVYGSERRTLVPGAYRWYVWPGFGALADAKYGALIGTSTFLIKG